MAIELTTATAEQISGIQDALNLDIPVLTEYPTTDATKVGQKFIYSDTEWKYHSQAELDSLGWTTVSEGFPAPVSKVYNPSVLFNKAVGTQSSSINVQIQGINGYSCDAFCYVLDLATQPPIKLNFLGFPAYAINAKLFKIYFNQPIEISEIKGFDVLYNLEDQGTGSAIYIYTQFGQLIVSDTVINDFFTQLPPTTKTATIDVSDMSGAATCDPTIATAKGYTVITS